MSANFTPERGDYKDLTPFRFWCQKVLPLVYDDSLSYYEVICKAIDYLNKSMEDIETLEEDVTNIYEAYTKLQAYVNEYFDNLDVQDEIDNKLDRLVADGTIHEIFNDDVVAILNQGVQARDEAIAAIPANVTNWLEQHVTQETGYVIDDSLTIQGAAADAKATGDAISDLKSDISDVNKIISLQENIAINCPIAGNGYIASNGKIGSNNAYQHTDYIDISNYSVVRYRRGGRTVTAVQYTAIYDADKTLIRTYRWASNQESDGYIETPADFTVENGDKYVRFTTFTDITTYGDFYAYIEATPLSNKLAEIDTDLNNKIEKSFETGVNLFSPEKAVSGYINANGGVSAGSAYLASDFIPIKNGQTVYVNKIRSFMAYDSNKSPISESFILQSVSNYTYTATQDGYIRASLFVESSTSNIIAYNGKPLYYEPYAEQIVPEKDVHLSYEMIDDVAPYTGNVLDGKKWVACGDSFTHGDFARSMTEDYKFTDSPYYNQNKVYPFWIGRRNKGLTVINEAISGSTMTAGESGVNPFSGTRYTDIPADTDYITLMFGINDSGNSCPIGTIDDTDNTTFYGAWNVVLEYFITNFPFAHIGIIVGPGMQTTQGKTYAEAEIAVAKKWGIPYLNIQFESGGEKIPLMLRTSNPNVSSVAKALRNAQQYVNNQEGSINMHPNEKAHEFESTFIEAWLKTL